MHLIYEYDNQNLGDFLLLYSFSKIVVFYYAVSYGFGTQL